MKPATGRYDSPSSGHNGQRVLKCALALAGSALAAALMGGCTTAPPAPTVFSYTPVPVVAPIDASVSIEALHVTASDYSKSNPALREAFFQLKNSESDAIAFDLATSGLFARVVPSGSPSPDYIVKVASQIYQDSSGKICPMIDYYGTNHVRLSNLTLNGCTLKYRVHLKISSGSTGKELHTYAREADLYRVAQEIPYPGGSELIPMGSPSEVMAGLVASLKASLLYDLRDHPLELKELARLQTSSLANLLASLDTSVVYARERNHMLIAAKTQQLPGLLLGSNTEELTALVVKIEQTILDLDHESEVAKDRAQQAAATNCDPRQVEELRGLSISYRERIELLKPIDNTIKEEIANRSK